MIPQIPEVLARHVFFPNQKCWDSGGGRRVVPKSFEFVSSLELRSGHTELAGNCSAPGASG